MLLIVIIVFFFLSVFVTLVKTNMVTYFGPAVNLCMMGTS